MIRIAVLLLCLGIIGLLAFRLPFRRAVILILCLAIGGFFGCHLLLGIHEDLPSMGVDAKGLIAQAGGPDKVCEEADQIFQKYGVTKQTFFYEDMLKDYPAVTSLGKVDYIMPEWPAYIKIRVGNHLRGYILEIADKNSAYKIKSDPHTLEVVKDRIFVRD